MGIWWHDPNSWDFCDSLAISSRQPNLAGTSLWLCWEAWQDIVGISGRFSVARLGPGFYWTWWTQTQVTFQHFIWLVKGLVLWKFTVYLMGKPWSPSDFATNPLSWWPQIPRFQGSSVVVVFRFSGSAKTTHHSLTQRLKSNRHCCWGKKHYCWWFHPLDVLLLWFSNFLVFLEYVPKCFFSLQLRSQNLVPYWFGAVSVDPLCRCKRRVCRACGAIWWAWNIEPC